VARASVNAANENLFFTVTLVSLPGRAGQGVDLKLAYNSMIRDSCFQGSTRYATLAERDSWVGAGRTLLVARVHDDSARAATIARRFWTAPIMI
jgi:hypothetical protein